MCVCRLSWVHVHFLYTCIIIFAYLKSLSLIREFHVVMVAWNLIMFWYSLFTRHRERERERERECVHVRERGSVWVHFLPYQCFCDLFLCLWSVINLACVANFLHHHLKGNCKSILSRNCSIWHLVIKLMVMSFFVPSSSFLIMFWAFLDFPWSWSVLVIGWNMGYRWVMTEREFRKWFIT